jgi:hypothetical protein
MEREIVELDSIPDDLISEILQLFDAREIQRLRLVNQTFRDIVDRESLVSKYLEKNLTILSDINLNKFYPIDSEEKYNHFLSFIETDDELIFKVIRKKLINNISEAELKIKKFDKNYKVYSSGSEDTYTLIFIIYLGILYIFGITHIYDFIDKKIRITKEMKKIIYNDFDSQLYIIYYDNTVENIYLIGDVNSLPAVNMKTMEILRKEEINGLIVPTGKLVYFDDKFLIYFDDKKEKGKVVYLDENKAIDLFLYHNNRWETFEIFEMSQFVTNTKTRSFIWKLNSMTQINSYDKCELDKYHELIENGY